MEKVKLGDIATIQSGGTPSRSQISYWKDGTIPWVKISDIKTKHLNHTEEFITEEGLAHSAAKIFKPGTILYTIFATLGECCILDVEATTNQAIVGIQIRNKLFNQEFLYYFLTSTKTKIVELGRGVAQNNINMKILKDMPIPLLPIKQQCKIAAILHKIDDLIDKRRQQLALLDTLVKSRFVEMFENENSSWPEVKIEDLCIQSRTGPFGSALHHDEFVEEGVFVLGIDNAVENKFSYKKMRYITKEKYEQLKRYTVSPGDVIITIMGTVGRSAVIPDDIPVAINTKHLACLTLDRKKANPYFISCAFQMHPHIVSQLDGQATGAIMDGLNLTKIRNLHFQCPPLENQNEFVKFYSQTDKSKQTIQQSLEQLETLKKALMQQYFEV